MKQKKFLLILSLASGAVMLLFTFCTLAVFSDANGVKWGFEIPVGTHNGPVSTLADVFWMLAPFSLVASAVRGFFEKGEKRFSLLPATLPLTLYAVLRLLLLAFGQASHGTIFITLGCVILLGLLGAAAVTLPELRRTGAITAAVYAGVEILLLVLSALLHRKLSFFYFFQWIPLGHSSGFSYSFFAVSPFLYYVCYAASLCFRFLSARIKKESTPAPQPPPGEKKREEDESEEDLSSLTLEDLGISR